MRFDAFPCPPSNEKFSTLLVSDSQEHTVRYLPYRTRTVLQCSLCISKVRTYCILTKLEEKVALFKEYGRFRRTSLCSLSKPKQPNLNATRVPPKKKQIPTGHHVRKDRRVAKIDNTALYASGKDKPCNTYLAACSSDERSQLYHCSDLQRQAER